jgi:hypothetical protein
VHADVAASPPELPPLPLLLPLLLPLPLLLAPPLLPPTTPLELPPPPLPPPLLSPNAPPLSVGPDEQATTSPAAAASAVARAVLEARTDAGRNRMILTPQHGPYRPRARRLSLENAHSRVLARPVRDARTRLARALGGSPSHHVALT